MGFGDQSKALNGNGATSLNNRYSLTSSLVNSTIEESFPLRLNNYYKLPFEEMASTRKFEETQLKQAANIPEDKAKTANADNTGASDENIPGAMIADMTATSFVSKIHTLYMQPGQDIQWRLGNTTRTLDDAKNFLVKDSDAGTTDKNGFIFTQVDFFQKHNVSKDYTENYINFFFPPYSKNEINGIKVEGDLSLQEAIDSQKIEKEITDKKCFGGKGQFYDPSSSLDYRGNFTFRTPAYKSINDSICYLQYLFERVSGIVSTYLTEWDLSLYQQESLVSENNKDFKHIPLTYRMKEDSPLKSILDKAEVTEGAYKTFGVLNCAVSKVENDPSSRWFPEEYVYSNNWTTIPFWGELKSQKKKTIDKETGKTIEVPEFYKKVLDINTFLQTKPDFKARVLFDDYQGMALAGWKNFDLSYAKALYTTDDDSLSKADVRCLSSNLEMVEADKVIAENFKENWGVSIYADEKGDIPDEAVYIDPEDQDDYEEKESKRSMDLTSTVRSTMVNQFLSGDVGENGDIGLPKDTANIVGICQRNPSLFGGPHGYTSSPLGVQSYFETNNVILRNSPRIAPCDLSLNVNNISSEEQIYKKENYFKSQGGPTDNKYYSFKGCEKFFTQNTSRGDKEETKVRPYEHSYKNGLNYLRDGLYSPGVRAVAEGVKQVMSTYHKEYITHADPVYEKDSSGHYVYKDGNKVVSYYNYYTTYEYPTYDKNGRFIYYQDGGSYSGGFTNCQVKPEDRWYFYNLGNYDSCARINWNKTSDTYYRRVHWKRGSWIGDYYSNEARWGKTLIPFRQEYTQYRLHSMPKVHWTLHKVDRNVIIGWKPVHWWWRIWNWFGFTHVKPEPITERRTVWELNFPDSYTFRELRLSGGGDASEKDSEQEMREKMIEMFGSQVGKPCHLIYCASDTRESYSDFEEKGVDTFIYAKTYSASCFTRIDKKVVKFGACGRRSEYWTTEDIETKFIAVDLDDPDNIIFSGLRNSGFRGNLHGANTFDNIKRSTIELNTSEGKTRIPSPDNLSHETAPMWAFNNVEWKSEQKTNGIEGYGILSCIPGILPKTPEIPSSELSYNQYLGHTEILQDTSLYNIPLRSYSLGLPSAIGEWENGNRYFDTSSTPPAIINTGSSGGRTTYEQLPSHIITSWIKACTSGTFYIDEQFTFDKSTGNFPSLTSYWRVPIDTAFRLFHNQVVYQLGYLRILNRIFSTKIVNDYALSFSSIKELLVSDGKAPGVCGEKVYKLSDPDINKTTIIEGENVNTYKVLGYNQWIKSAREIFEKDPVGAQTKFISKLNTRITLFEEWEEYFNKIYLLDSHQYSWNNIKDLYEKMIKIYNEVNTNQYIEETFYAYMNILYEYRRFFINKRCNKMDGTLWMIRSLESALPLILASIETTPPKDITVATASGEEKVALYAFQNTNSQKLNSIANKLNQEFEEDRISRLFIKVRYATEEEYKADQEAVKKAREEQKEKEPSIIEVAKWEPKRNEKGRLLFDDNDTVQKEYTGEKVYIYKPINGKYRLESREYLNNLSKINRAKTLYPTVEIDENNKIKDKEVVSKLHIKDFDTAIWDIDWDSLDIIFGVISEVDIPKAIEALEAIPDLEIDDFVCICEKKADYWDVPITSNLPRPDGYKSELKVKLFTESEPRKTDSDPETIVHPFTNSICPITENQKYGGLSPEDIIRLHMNHDSLLQAEQRI